MNTHLIPSYDMLGLPTPPWLAQVLMALTLALHWAFLGATVGGTAIVLLNALRGRRELNRALTPFLPFFLSMAMTMGIAPLLFVHVLYGHLFYTSNILLGYWWLGLLVIVIVNFYLFWWAWHRARQDKPVPWLIPALALLVFVKAAVILSSNATLMQTPEAWEGLWAKGMNRLYGGDPSLVPRVLFALTGFVGAGGLVVAILSRAGLLYKGEAATHVTRTGLGLALAALSAQAAFGIIFLIALPPAQRGELVDQSLALFVAILALGTSVLFTALALRAKTLLKVALPGVACFVGLLALADARDDLRRVALARYYRLAEVPVHPEWSNLALFLVIFLAGLGTIAYLVKLARTKAAA